MPSIPALRMGNRGTAFHSLAVALLAAAIVSGGSQTRAAGPPADPAGTPFCCRTGRSGMTFLAELPHAPFPYDGRLGDAGKDFLDYIDPDGGRRYHTSRDGRRYPERGHYDDSRALFHVPPSFDPGKSFIWVVYLHGGSVVVGPALRGQRIMEQVDESGANCILVAPQMAKGGAEPNPGKFQSAGSFRLFMEEASSAARAEMGLAEEGLKRGAPIILAAQGEASEAAAFILDRGGLERSIAGVILFDAVSGEAGRFASWLSGRGREAFFISIFTPPRRPWNKELMALLRGADIAFRDAWPAETGKGTISFIAVETAPEKVPLLGPPEAPLYLFLRDLAK